MKKAIGQTVRDLRRGVNKKVLKVPTVEQKVLDATSNEPWGPHGSSLADIAQATRNYHEYQIIMSIIWKRINDTGKNWRHVYKALTILEYLVANGSERVIDEIKEHGYQISTLSGFQYIDSGGRDQGLNVRKKSQILVALVNNKERIQEVREKAAANKEKFRNPSMGGMYGERYDDERYKGRYGVKYEDRNGYGRERDWGSRDNDRYGSYGDSNSRDGDWYVRDYGDRYVRDYEGRYGRDGYRDDDSRGRSPSMDDYNYGPRSRSSDRDRDRSYEDDGQYSSRGSVGKADGSQDGRSHDKKYSEQDPAAPPSYEKAVGEVGSPAHSERYEETSTVSAPKFSSPPSTTHQETTTTSPPAATPPDSVPPTAHPSASVPPAAHSSASVSPPASVPATVEKEFKGFDEFDPRGPFTAAPPSSNGAEVDFFGSSLDPYNLSSLTIVPTATATAAATSEANALTNSDSGNGFFSDSTSTNQVSTSTNQPFEDPFGDTPFKAIPSTENFSAQQQNVSPSSFHPNPSHPVVQQPTLQENSFDFGETDILADILPPPGSSPSGFSAQTVLSASQTGFASQTNEPETSFQGQIIQPTSTAGFQSQPRQSSSQTSFPPQVTHVSSMIDYAEQAGQTSKQAGFPHQSGQYPSFTGFPSQASSAQPAGFPSPSQYSHPGPNYNVNFNQQPAFAASTVESLAAQSPSGSPGPAPQLQQAESSSRMAPASLDSTNYLAVVPQPAKDKFEPKSTIWKDTLNRGLVNLNISGPKANPLDDIGVDFDAINRKEKRMEKPSQTPVMSTVTMGKAMGSGSGIGRAGASALRGGPNPVASGMNIGMGGVSGPGMGLGGARGAGLGMGMVSVPGGGIGMGGGPNAGMGMGMPMGGGYGVNQSMGGGYGGNQPMGGGYGVNQPIGGMGIDMGMGMNLGAGMNMGMGRGVLMQQQPTGFSQVPSLPGGYNPVMGTGNFGQQPYNGGH
ncbi:clathrin interactor EPSIN 2-like isoform X1 [Apium graveolens]|uniref:clathrin interactor EPSIN 2-like isoform X1 n=1 Tax=Apium graveolens TaxID=4045 RepID=UPI003D790905